MTSPRALERAAIRRAVTMLGAEVLVNIDPPELRTRSQRAGWRDVAVANVTACTACGLCDLRAKTDHIGPRYPSLTGAMQLTIVTPTPIDTRDPDIALVKGPLSRIIDTAAVAWVPVVSCQPRHAEGGGKRAASGIEIRACEPNLHDAIEAANAPNVLLVGQKAVDAWRKDVKIGAMAGVVGTWMNRYMVAAVDHPATVRTGTKAEKVEYMAKVEAAIRRLEGAEVGGGKGCMDLKCAGTTFAWDGDALPWCETHFDPKPRRGVKQYRDERLW